MFRSSCDCAFAIDPRYVCFLSCRVYRFLRRNPEVAKRRAQSLELQRARAFNEHAVQMYFNLVGRCLAKLQQLSESTIMAGNTFVFFF